MIHFPTFQQKADKALGATTYDFSMPQEWFNRASDISNNNPSGHVVWAYDSISPLFGRPYPTTLLGWIIVRLDELHNGGY